MFWELGFLNVLLGFVASSSFRGPFRPRGSGTELGKFGTLFDRRARPPSALYFGRTPSADKICSFVLEFAIDCASNFPVLCPLPEFDIKLSTFSI